MQFGDEITDFSGIQKRSRSDYDVDSNGKSNKIFNEIIEYYQNNIPKVKIVERFQPNFKSDTFKLYDAYKERNEFVAYYTLKNEKSKSKFVYDGRNKLIRISSYKDSKVISESIYKYDANGNKSDVKIIIPKYFENEISYDYRADGILDKLSLKNGDKDLEQFSLVKSGERTLLYSHKISKNSLNEYIEVTIDSRNNPTLIKFFDSEANCKLGKSYRYITYEYEYK